ncbi:MAG: phosphoribosylamine--glycine ligase [Bacteroidetes bacterium GWC2_33_15]|nr:MAG: phosphoribosylamine--glycine ligase [Bacteroidetes bacterium GWA2_33_15]OFX48995.1 MAG: phosphoribosylamine--glycine ligase [Bacteroidetes bacterium GWC2_33_15]OFX64741.1 MAG: phosphoribosylamine--glycine ligase [Bacteroidetes bacterium GWB2_32_14]OFX68443.1 MAG: phosphoribosylamine--glycine ligase [Bacteroidetes bacterium GWD2_33_33]HAN19166.1 phosphoribosylamine--glycine ligase [Bacteroidales bacterium]
MNVLLIGSGGRENAIAWKIAKSPRLSKLFITPGNAGTAGFGENVNINTNDFSTIKSFVLEKQIELVIVGPEQPLVDGIHDYFLADDKLNGIPLIGPVKAGAILEGSKDFAKFFMQKYNIPTAKYKTFTKDTLTEGYRFLEQLKPPYVLKADGLASGKGVIILDDLNKTKETLEEMLNGKFGKASNKVVIEEFLEGLELSVFIITDGKNYKILPEAKDYKRIGEGDTGLNTGGMGAVSPVPFANNVFMEKVEKRIIIPTIEGLKKENIHYKGFIFFGLICVNGEPYVIEYNVRLGDPETEVVIPRIKSDFLDLMMHVANETLDKASVETDPNAASTIMLVSGGYPGNYENGKIIKNLNLVNNSLLFHAGTRIDGNSVVSNGGRVLAITSYGETIFEALNKSRENADIIDFEGKYYRKDIGFDLK